MKMLLGLSNETWEQISKRPTALKAFIACFENKIDAYKLCKNHDLCAIYSCGQKAVFDNAELINKALEERGE